MLLMCSQSTVVTQSTYLQQKNLSEATGGSDEETITSSRTGIEQRQNMQSPKRHGRMIVKVRTTSLFSKHVTVLELWSSSIPNTWGFYLRPRYIVPWDSEIFSLAAKGDMQKMRELFVMGSASPFDTRGAGWTVLDVAVSHHHTEAFRYLIGQGADPNIPVYSSALVAAHQDIRRDATPEVVHILEKMSEPVEDPLDWHVRNLRPLSRASTLGYFLKISQSSHVSRTNQEIVDFIFRIYNTYSRVELTGICKLMLKGSDIAGVVHTTGHWSIQKLFSALICDQVGDSRRKSIDEWIFKVDLDNSSHLLSSIWGYDSSLVVEFIKAGVYLHGFSMTYYNLGALTETPFYHLIISMIWSNYRLDEILMAWLLLLKDCGANLTKYGRR